MNDQYSVWIDVEYDSNTIHNPNMVNYWSIALEQKQEQSNIDRMIDSIIATKTYKFEIGERILICSPGILKRPRQSDQYAFGTIVFRQKFGSGELYSINYVHGRVGDCIHSSHIRRTSMLDELLYF